MNQDIFVNRTIEHGKNEFPIEFIGERREIAMISESDIREQDLYSFFTENTFNDR